MAKNQVEIRVCGLQRSGNHAIIDWIVEQFSGKKVCFLNNVKHGNHNPFLSCAQIFTYGFEGVSEGLVSFEGMSQSLRVEFRKELQGKEKDVLIYSYEDDRNQIDRTDSFLESACSAEFEANKNSYLGESLQFYDAIIIRDPYNFLASRLTKIQNRTGIKDVEIILSFWKEIAKQCISSDSSQHPERIILNYNKWFSQKAYREQLCEKLGGTFSDRSINKVSTMGKGSSFDGKGFDRKQMLLKLRKVFIKPRKILKAGKYLRKMFGARKMNVLERFKHLKDDERMINLISDVEVQHLSKKLFGNVL